MRDARGGCRSAGSIGAFCSNMQNPTRLRVFAASEDLAVVIYTLVRSLPQDERFGLAQQMRRAAVSIGSNIAEGCGRSGNRELVRFLCIALGSATELEFQLRLAHRLGMLAEAEFRTATERLLSVERMLSRLVVRLRPQKG
jgi:four helix bundle protein